MHKTKSESRSTQVLLVSFQSLALLCVSSLVLTSQIFLLSSSSSSDQLHQAGVCVSLGSSLQKKDCGGDQEESQFWRGVASGNQSNFIYIAHLELTKVLYIDKYIKSTINTFRQNKCKSTRQ